MTTVNILEDNIDLKQLVDRAAKGEDVVLSEDGKPVARVIAIHPKIAFNQPGPWQGKVEIADDFDELPEDVAAAFRGERP